MSFEAGRFLQLFTETTPANPDQGVSETLELPGGIHGRYLRLLRTYGGLEVSDHKTRDGKHLVWATRRAPYINVPLSRIPGIPNRMFLAVHLSTSSHSVTSEVPASQIENLDVPDDITVFFQLNAAPYDEWYSAGDKRNLWVGYNLSPEEIVRGIHAGQSILSLESAPDDEDKLRSASNVLEDAYKKLRAK